MSHSDAAGVMMKKSTWGSVMRSCVLAILVLGVFSLTANAQTISQCRQSFAGFNGSQNIKIAATGETASCHALNELRNSLDLTDAKVKQLADAKAKIGRFRNAIDDARDQLEREARATTRGGLKTAARGFSAAWATFKAINSCTKSPTDVSACVRRVLSAQESVDRALTTYYDEYETNKILQNSSQSLISILEDKIKLTASGAVTDQGQADAFLATCALVASQCVTPPPAAPILP